MVIAGGGPAGATTALALRQLGIPCMVLEMHTTTYKAGERIPPHGYPLFRQLGIEYILQDERHTRPVNSTVIWGQEEDRPLLAGAQGCNQPTGLLDEGFPINRPYFEKQLRWSAENKGAQWLPGWRCIDCREEPDHLSIICCDPDGERKVIPAVFLVDASGRTALVAHQMGSRRRYIDQLTSYCTQWKPLPTALAGSTLTEAVENGWWQATAVSNQHLALHFMTDADLQEGDEAWLPQWLTDQLQQTMHLRHRLTASHGHPFAKVHTKSVATAHLDQLAGPGWLAVGDAACTFDPISNYGLYSALNGSLHAALAIKEYLLGNTDALNVYCAVQQASFQQCRCIQQHQYRQEQRWPDSLFWKRRHAGYRAMVG